MNKKNNLLLPNRLSEALKGNLLSYFDISDIEIIQKRKDFVEWLLVDLDSLVEDFFLRDDFRHKRFINKMNRIFNTCKFDNLVKKYVNGYLYNFFLKLDYCFFEQNSNEKLILEDNPLNRFAISKYKLRFNIESKIKWKKSPNFLFRGIVIFFHASNIVYQGIRTGFAIFEIRKKYKVMRELKWGFKGVNGNYFHDDFMVDNNKIKVQDLLIFIRRVPKDTDSTRIYDTLKSSPYDYFDLRTLSISIHCFLFRIIKKYLVFGCSVLLSCINSQSFSLFSSIFYYFIVIGIPFEKVFSNYEIISIFGHSNYLFDHNIEAIVCNNHGAKYYLSQLSDGSIEELKDVSSFLGCDYIFAWGKAHKSFLETNSNAFFSTGYLFKSFIDLVHSNRSEFISKMKLDNKRKNIVFFDENCGGLTKTTTEFYIHYWETISDVLEKFKNEINVIVKPKDPLAYLVLSERLKKRYLEIINFLSKSENFYFLGYPEWSFIELIGIADVVITFGMTSSSTIAIICGIEGIYFDKEGLRHPFSRLFKDKIVFSDREKIVEMIEKIVSGKDSVFNVIPQNLLKEFNNSDVCALDLARDIFSGNYNISRVDVHR